MSIRRAVTAAPARRRTRAPTRERLSTEERREQLLAVGKTLFLERPYDQVSMDDVAQRAGVSKALIFHYFSTKRDLYVELVKRSAANMVKETYVGDSGAPPIERLNMGLHRYLEFVERNSRAYVGLLTGGVGVDPEVYGVVENVRRKLAERIVTNLPFGAAPSAYLAVRGYIGFVESSSLVWLENKTMSRDELVALWVRLLVSVLLPPSQ